MSARRKRGSAPAVAQSLQRKPVGELERIAFGNAHDERLLWAVLGVLQHRRGQGADLLKTQIRERLVLKKPLPAPLRGSAVWTTSVRRPRRRRWYATTAYVMMLALLIAGARVTEADARLVELVLDGVRTLGTYLSEIVLNGSTSASIQNVNLTLHQRNRAGFTLRPLRIDRGEVLQPEAILL